MTRIKISAVVEENAWEELKAIAFESRRPISGLLSEAIAEYVKRRRFRPVVMRHLERSIEENRELGRLLAQ